MQSVLGKVFVKQNYAIITNTAEGMLSVKTAVLVIDMINDFVTVVF
jgi:hypothetical protein